MSQRRSFQDIILSSYFIIFFWFWLIIVKLTTFLFWVFRVRQIKKYFSKGEGKKRSVLYLEVFSPQSAGNKYRTSKWAEILNANGFHARSKYVYEQHEYRQLTSQPNLVFFHMEFLWKRFLQCLSSLSYDIVIVRREILMFNDYGNLFFEKLLSNTHSHLILDFDDDISFAKHEPRKISFYGKLMLEHPEKFRASLKYYNAFIPGSNYLKQWLLENGVNPEKKKIQVVPTCVDYDLYSPKKYEMPKQELLLGWIGSRESLHNLEIIIPSLNQLSLQHRFKLVVVCDKPFLDYAVFPIINIRWSEEKELQNFQLLDIGLMPLKNTPAQKGKCGFKLIQYMGCGLVSVANALTVNNEIVDDGANGFLVEPDGDWKSVLEKVFAQQNRFSEIGQNAFRKIHENYSFSANTNNYVSFLRDIIK